MQQVYERLLAHYGPQGWWPGESPFEVMVGAVLVQNTAWKNVRRAIDNLREEGLLEPHRLYELPPDELAELIRPAGYFRLKTKRLRNLLQLIIDKYDGSLDEMFANDAATLREQLLGVNGIGPETADSILLYAAEKPVFVVDNYTHRILSRHGWLEPEADYHQMQGYMSTSLPVEVPLFNEFHALLVRVGHEHCRRTPKCDGCPLEELLPEYGIANE